MEGECAGSGAALLGDCKPLDLARAGGTRRCRQQLQVALRQPKKVSDRHALPPGSIGMDICRVPLSPHVDALY